MRLPRPLLWTMLLGSVASVLAAAGWWWVTWPERTAREFVDLVASGDIDAANSMRRQDPDRRRLPVKLRREGDLVYVWASESNHSGMDEELFVRYLRERNAGARRCRDLLEGRIQFDVGPTW